MPGSGIDGCRTGKEVRAVVNQLVAACPKSWARTWEGELTTPEKPNCDTESGQPKDKGEGQCGRCRDEDSNTAPNLAADEVVVRRPRDWEQDFERWWDEKGQYCRAGGGAYEKTFAYRAWESALMSVLGAELPLPGNSEDETDDGNDSGCC